MAKARRYRLNGKTRIYMDDVGKLRPARVRGPIPDPGGCRYIENNPGDRDWPRWCGATPLVQPRNRWCEKHHARVYIRRPFIGDEDDVPQTEADPARPESVEKAR